MDFKFAEDNFFQVINLMSVNSEISKKKKKYVYLILFYFYVYGTEKW
jgi:hypothetical protein